jgi:aspartate/glutamate racemase
MSVTEINTVDRPHSIALITAIENCIEDIAPNHMTAIEVLGVLDTVSKMFYEDNLSKVKRAIINQLPINSLKTHT